MTYSRSRNGRFGYEGVGPLGVVNRLRPVSVGERGCGSRARARVVPTFRAERAAAREKSSARRERINDRAFIATDRPTAAHPRRDRRPSFVGAYEPSGSRRGTSVPEARINVSSYGSKWGRWAGRYTQEKTSFLSLTCVRARARSLARSCWRSLARNARLYE